MYSLRLYFLLILLFSGQVQGADLFSRKHDSDFEKYSGMYMPGRNWKLLKAQCFQESRFVTTAVSPVGAMGLCQFMPATWDEQERNLKIRGSSFDATLNIQFAAYYMSKLRAVWKSPRPLRDRESLAMASYNAGTGNILKAQKKCGNKATWADISPCLKNVTGVKNSHETHTYVSRIWKYYSDLGAIL